MGIFARRPVKPGWKRRALWAALLAAAGLVWAAGASAQDAFEDDDGGAHEPAIDALAEEGVLEGTECGRGRICPGGPFHRWVMGVWIIRALGERPSQADTRFTDVAAGSWWAPHVERLAEMGVTSGCSAAPLRYCPDRPVTRGQMAAFLVRAFDLDPGSSAGFTDTARSPHAANIDALAAARITSGCSAAPLRYCPDRPVTRGQMATFLARALGLVAVPAPPQSSPPASGSSATLAAEEVLAGLAVAPERRTGYDRDLFDHWSDLDGDGCDTRREVLIRDSTIDVGYDRGRTCWIVSGRWYSRYDNVWVADASSLDIDHLVPLAEAWDSGASGWSADLREAFANDQAALIAVTARSNRAKSASDPAEWMPSNQEFTCPYAAGWVATKARWGLSVDQREKSFLGGLLAGACSGLTIKIDAPFLDFPVLQAPGLSFPTLSAPLAPASGGSAPPPPAPPVSPPAPPAPPASPPAGAAAPPNPGNTKNCSDFDTREDAQEWFDRYFPHYGDVARLDRNGDGAACESLPRRR